MAASVERIKELLGNGLSNEIVAKAVGCTSSYISQLLSDEQFREEVVILRSQNLLSASQRDHSWNSIEEKLLEKFSELVDQGMIFKTRDVLFALATVNKAVRRGIPAQEQISTPTTIVNLTIPTVVVNSFKKNAQGEVIEVTRENGTSQTLVTMPATTLMQQLLSKHQGNKEYDKIRNHLPASGRTEIQQE
jgi:transcriptional regulator with XRE-family HTH domain